MDLFRQLRWGWGRPMDPIPTGIKYPDYQGPVIIIEPPAEPIEAEEPQLPFGKRK